MKAYIRNIVGGENTMKVLIGIYDETIDAKDRTETYSEINIPYNQPDAYIDDLVKIELEKFKSKTQDYENKKKFVGKIYS